MLKLKVLKLNNNAMNLKQAYDSPAGMDIAITHIIEVGSKYVTCGTNIALEIPHGYHAEFRPRSSLSNTGWILSHSIGTIDSDYRGEIMARIVPTSLYLDSCMQMIGLHLKPTISMAYDYAVELLKTSLPSYLFQIVVVKNEDVEIEYVDELQPTKRGTGAFGSSNK